MEVDMADQAAVHTGENSPEYIAFRLFKEVASTEAQALRSTQGYNRKYILDTYAECLNTVQNPTGRGTP